MKRILLIAISIVLPLTMAAQAQIITKDAKIEDFQEKTTKIVLSGNEFFDSALSEEIRTKWYISPFEFCSTEEFEKMKDNSDYYFLLLVKSRFRKESVPGIDMLTLIKGGEDSGQGIGKMLELVSVPFCSSAYPSGREFIFLPALIDIIQAQVSYVLEKNLNAYSSLSRASRNITNAEGMSIVFSRDDLSSEITPETEELYFHDGIEAADEDAADSLMLANTPETLVSYTVAPSDPVPGSYCYKMLIDAGSHELYYFRKHRITKKTGPGFLPEDIMRIASERK